MEFLRGRDLSRVAYEEGPLAFRRVVDILKQVLEALGEAHHLEIIHRDLKPENVIIEPLRAGGDFVKVVDFGLAKMQESQNAPSITSPGIVCGTPEYMSPEQGRGDPLDPRSDLYAVGVILFQLLTGRLPFEAESPTQVVLMHLSKAPPDPASGRARAHDPDSARRGGASIAVERAARSLLERRRIFARAFCSARAHRRPGKRTHVDAKRSSLPKMRRHERALAKILRRMRLVDRGRSRHGNRASVADARASGWDRSQSQSSMAASVRRPSGSARTIHGPLPLVGREEDVQWLEDRRTDARASLSAARIVGDSGMGKSRLVREFLLTSAAAGDVVVVTGPDPTWSEVGFFALRKAMQALAALPPDGGRASDWVATTPEARCGIADVFHITDNSEEVARLSPDERRFAAAEALRWALARASERARGKRVVLAVDDLQSVDGGSRNAFVDVVAEPPLVPVLLVAAHTPDFNPDWPGHVAAPG